MAHVKMYAHTRDKTAKNIKQPGLNDASLRIPLRRLSENILCACTLNL